MSQPNAPTAPAAPTNPLVTIPLDPDALKKWHADLDLADKRRKVFEPSWEKNLKAYTPDPTNATWGDEVNPGVDFYQVEQKKNQLFFATPMVILTADDGAPPPVRQAIAGHQTRLNKKLGAGTGGLDVKRLMDEVSFDILCPSGIGCTKIGVTRITKDVPVPHPTDPTQPNLGPDGQPITAPVPVFVQLFWERFSPKQWLTPVNFHSTRFDKAPWQGMKFTMATRAARRIYQLPPDFAPKATQPTDQFFQHPGVTADESADDQVTGTEVWYKASLYDDTVWHPDAMRQLVFIDGIDEPVVHRDSPYQTLDPQTGTFTPDSLIGNPIHCFTIRGLSDSAFVPSDCTIHRPLVNELARYRTQVIESRDACTPVRLADGSIITPDVLAKIVRSPVGAIIVVPSLPTGQEPMRLIAPATLPRETYQGQDIIERDISKVDAISANQTGASQDGDRSATEISYIQRSSDVRLDGERQRLIADFLAGVRKLDALLKRFEPQPDEQPIASYDYDIKPDSGMHIDAAADRKFALDRYNFLAKDPNCNRKYLLTETAPLLHLDPTQLIVEPPPPSAPPPKTTMVIRGEDLSPLNPQYANVLQVLQHEGVQGLAPAPITPQMVQNAATVQQAAHPGTAPKGDLVSKHVADQSGQIQNVGGHAGSVQ